jgi:AcrR family transcriptional regulator
MQKFLLLVSKRSAVFSMTRRQSYHHGDLPQALKTLAVDMIAQQGVAAFSMREAAARLGVAPSALYRHFADKSDLFAAIALDGFRAMGERWQRLMEVRQAQAGPSPAAISLARFAAGANAYFQFAIDNPALFQLMYGPFGTGAFGLAKLQELGEANPPAILARVLDDLRDAGVISAAARAQADVKAYAAIHGVACLAVAGVFKELSPGDVWAQVALVMEGSLGALLAAPTQCL